MSFKAGERATALMTWLIGSAGIATGLLIGGLAGWLWTPLLWLLIPLCVGVVGFLWFYPRRWVAGFSGEMTAECLLVHRGVFWRREQWLLLSALRSVSLWEPPLHRRFGCRTLILRGTGGSVVLPLLGYSQAAALWRRLEALA